MNCPKCGSAHVVPSSVFSGYYCLGGCPPWADAPATVLCFTPRAVGLLWSPRRGTNPAWRLRASGGQVIDFLARRDRMECERLAAYRAQNYANSNW